MQRPVILDGVSRTLSARYYKDGSEILIEQDGKNPRKLTPRECARLQGFPDDMVQKAREIGLSDARLYKMAGNAVTVNVVEAVARKLAEVCYDRT